MPWRVITPEWHGYQACHDARPGQRLVGVYAWPDERRAYRWLARMAHDALERDGGIAAAVMLELADWRDREAPEGARHPHWDEGELWGDGTIRRAVPVLASARLYGAEITILGPSPDPEDIFLGMPETVLAVDLDGYPVSEEGTCDEQ